MATDMASAKRASTSTRVGDAAAGGGGGGGGGAVTTPPVPSD